MSNITEEEYLRAERQRKKNLQHFITNQQRLANNHGKHFNEKQLTHMHTQSYPYVSP
jgi:hypothetical protein